MFFLQILHSDFVRAHEVSQATYCGLSIIYCNIWDQHVIR